MIYVRGGMILAHPTITARRHAAAQGRVIKAARKLAKHHGLKGEVAALETATSRDPAFAQMLQAEALADLMETVTSKMADLEEEIIQASVTPEVETEVPSDAVGSVTVETIQTLPVEDKGTKSAKVAAARKPADAGRKAGKDADT